MTKLNELKIAEEIENSFKWTDEQLAAKQEDNRPFLEKLQAIHAFQQVHRDPAFKRLAQATREDVVLILNAWE